MAKKEEFIPVDLVKRLYAQGKGETDVITQLRSQGFTPVQIDKALKAVPKPRHEPGPFRQNEEYSGPLPKEVVRPMPKAEAPAHRTFTPEPLEGGVGAPSENVTIPDELKPMEITAHSSPKPAPKKEIKAELPMPAPVSAGVPGAPKINLEELVEQIVNEQEKKLFIHMDKLQSEHDANVKKLNELSSKLADISNSLTVLEKAVDNKSSFAADSNKELATKVDALETAFKGLAHLLHKK